MSERILIGLTGLPGTGKSTLCEYLAEEHNFLILEGSTILKSFANEAGLRLTSRESYDGFFRDMQRAQGMSWLSDITIGASHDRVLQGGLRSRYDFNQIKRAGGLIAALVCPPAIALERIDTSNPKNAQTIEEYQQHVLLEESTEEFGTHTGWCVDNADIKLHTDKPIEETFADVDALINSLTKT